MRRLWKRLVPLFLGILVSISVVQGPVYNALGVKGSDFVESISIPLQQIVYSIKCGAELTDEQSEVLNQMMDVEAAVDVYNHYNVDYIKHHESFDNEYLNEHKTEVLAVWLELLPSNFANYVKAWLMQTRGYWNWPTTNWVILGEVYDGPINSMGVEALNIFGVDLREIVNNGFDFLRTLPVIRNLYNISFTFWVTVFYAVVMAVSKRGKYVVPIIPLIALWGTMMIAAPVFCKFRYVFAFHLAWPFLLGTMFFAPNKLTKRNEAVEKI